MAKTDKSTNQPVETPTGSRQGRPGLNEPGRADRRSERERLSEDPNLNQAGNDRGSLDQTQGSQTGSDIDLLPEG